MHYGLERSCDCSQGSVGCAGEGPVAATSAASSVGLQAVAAAAATELRAAKADLSEHGMEGRDGTTSAYASSSAAGSLAGDMSEETTTILDSDMSWGFIRDLKEVSCSLRDLAPLWLPLPVLHQSHVLH